MRYKLIADVIVDAIQWTGANLADVQAFMAPESPLSHGTNGLGINAYKGEKYQTTELKFLKVNDYIVKDARGLHTLTQESFEASYQPALDEPVVPIPPPAPIWEEHERYADGMGSQGGI